MSLDAESLLQTVGDHIHLKRERSLATFQQAIESNYFQSHPKCLQIVQMGVLSLVASDQWEKRLGGLKVAALLVTAGVGDEPFTDAMIQTCKNLLEDPEVRVRWAVGELLRALCEQHGTIVWEAVKKRILDSIRENFVGFVFFECMQMKFPFLRQVYVSQNFMKLRIAEPRCGGAVIQSHASAPFDNATFGDFCFTSTFIPLRASRPWRDAARNRGMEMSGNLLPGITTRHGGLRLGV